MDTSPGSPTAAGRCRPTGAPRATAGITASPRRGGYHRLQPGSEPGRRRRRRQRLRFGNVVRGAADGGRAGNRDRGVPGPVDAGGGRAAHGRHREQPRRLRAVVHLRGGGHGSGRRHAAHRPGGVGTETRMALLEATRFVAPAAWGDVGARLAGVEVAAFDARNAPFWSPARALFAAPAPRFPGPRLDDESGIERLGPAAHLAWAEAPPRGARDPKLRIAAGAAPGAGLTPEAPEWRGFGISAQPFPAGIIYVASRTRSNPGRSGSGEGHAPAPPAARCGRWRTAARIPARGG